MNALEKIIKFNSYADLINEIQRDMADAEPLRCRYPVRFIMLNNFNVFTKFAKDLSTLGVESLNLEDLIDTNHERWITSDDLVLEIKSLSRTTLITPFSELVRFYEEQSFKGLFNEIMLIEDLDHPQKRIYIPLIGLQNRFGSFLDAFARIEESAPVWAYIEDEHKTEVYLSQTPNIDDVIIPSSNICFISTVYEWLRFWKNQAPQTKIVVSSGPIYRRSKFSTPDNIFTFNKIENAYQYINSIWDIHFPFEYEPEDEIYWKNLLKDINTNGQTSFSFSSYVSNRFNFIGVSPPDILIRWVNKGTSDYERWLIKKFFLHSNIAQKCPYLSLCINEIKKLNSPRDLPNKIVGRIFYFYEKAEQYRNAAERESLIKDSSEIIRQLTDENVKLFASERIKEISNQDMPLALSLCSGEFEFEKTLLVDWYAHKDKTGLSKETLDSKYPELCMYLSDELPFNKSKNDWHLRYLKAYREAKLADCYSEEVGLFIKDKNHNKDTFYRWYHSFEESHALLFQHITDENLKPDKTYWIDAMGAEFLPFLLSFFDSNDNYRVIYSSITRCTIPSATKQNKFDDAEKFSDLDDVAHDKHGYKEYSTIVKELEVLQSIMKNIVESNSHGEHTIAIVSDHGLSCLSRKVDSKKYDAKVEHEGRYIIINSDKKIIDDADFIVHENENDCKRYKVALTHASLGKKPTHEVHGGCTPEEVLVPYLIITNKTKGFNKYNYTLITYEIHKTNPEVIIGIMPQPPMVKLSIGNSEFQMKRSNSQWKALIVGIEEGEYKATFNIPNGNSFKTTIKIIGTGVKGNNFLDF